MAIVPGGGVGWLCNEVKVKDDKIGFEGVASESHYKCSR